MVTKAKLKSRIREYMNEHAVPYTVARQALLQADGAQTEGGPSGDDLARDLARSFGLDTPELDIVASPLVSTYRLCVVNGHIPEGVYPWFSAPEGVTGQGYDRPLSAALTTLDGPIRQLPAGTAFIATGMCCRAVPDTWGATDPELALVQGEAYIRHRSQARTYTMGGADLWWARSPVEDPASESTVLPHWCHPFAPGGELFFDWQDQLVFDLVVPREIPVLPHHNATCDLQLVLSGLRIRSRGRASARARAAKYLESVS